MHHPDPARDVSPTSTSTQEATPPAPGSAPWRWIGLVMLCLVSVLGIPRSGTTDRESGSRPIEGAPAPARIEEAAAPPSHRWSKGVPGPDPTTERDVNARFAARLAGLNVHGGVLQMLRVATWQMTLADAVLASPKVVEEPLQRILEAAGATRAEGEQVLYQYPVSLDDVPADAHRQAIQAAVAYPQVLQILQEALSPLDHPGLRDPKSLDLLATEGLRCAWLTSCSVAALHGFAAFMSQDLLACGLPGWEDEVRDQQRQAADVARWCAEYFAARLVEWHHIEPATALHLATALGRIAEGQQATSLQLFPPRDARD